MINTNKIAARRLKLKHFKYSLQFEDIRDKWSEVKFCKDGNIANNFKIHLDDEKLEFRNSANYSPILADILDLALAIQIADRVCNQNMKYPAREITVTLPVKFPELISEEANIERLKDLLFWTTGSNWIFIFTHQIEPLRYSETIQNLPFPIPETEVALWSGGLDALAGLYFRAKESTNKFFTLLGTGSNASMFGKQKDIYNSLPRELKSRTSLFQMKIRTDGIDKINKNYFLRSRGVVFALIGSVVAILRGQKELNIYENGIGALNLPYSESSIGLDHSRSVHPITLNKVSSFISELVGEKFEIKNPFLYSTKTEMLKYLFLDKRIDLINKSMSCDKPHREVIIQCGYCSSCILRRLSVYNANFEDFSQYKIMDLKSAKKENRKYFDHMNYQVLRITKALDSQDTNESKWEAFSKLFPDLDEIIDLKYETEKRNISEIKYSFLKTYENYIIEWNKFYYSL